MDPEDTLPADSVVIATVRERNPELSAMAFEVQSAERSASLARRDTLPDVTVGVETIVVERSDLTNFRDSGQDAWILNVSVPLPVFRSKYNGAIREATAVRTSREVSRRDRELALLADVEHRLFELHDAERRIDLYTTGLIPMGRQALESATTAFETGAGRFIDVLDAEQVLLQFRLELARAHAERGPLVVSLLGAMGSLPKSLPPFEEDEK